MSDGRKRRSAAARKWFRGSVRKPEIRKRLGRRRGSAEFEPSLVRAVAYCAKEGEGVSPSARSHAARAAKLKQIEKQLAGELKSRRAKRG